MLGNLDWKFSGWVANSLYIGFAVLCWFVDIDECVHFTRYDTAAEVFICETN